jgi:S-DNA-T family DNA segregation ATPase FtsK/SpoIIIE
VAHAGLDIDEVRASIAAAAHRWPAGPQLPDPDAIRMLPLPATVTLADLSGVDGRLMLGLAGEERSPVGIDPFSGPRRLLIAGPPRSGRSSVLQLLAQQASAAGIRTLVAATGRSPLRGAAESLAVPVLDPTSERLEDVPETPTLVLVDDVECYTDTVAGDRLACWARAVDAPLAMVVSGRADELATSYRGLAAEVRRHHCGILLRPGPVDGELLGVRLPRRPVGGPPGRGVAVGEPSWGPLFASGEPVPIQMATP